MSDKLIERTRHWCDQEAVMQVWEDGYSKNRTAADSAIFEASEIISEYTTRLQAAEAVCRAAECLRIPEYGNKPRGWDKLGEALAAWEATCKS